MYVPDEWGSIVIGTEVVSWMRFRPDHTHLVVERDGSSWCWRHVGSDDVVLASGRGEGTADQAKAAADRYLDENRT